MIMAVVEKTNERKNDLCAELPITSRRKQRAAAPQIRPREILFIAGRHDLAVRRGRGDYGTPRSRHRVKTKFAQCYSVNCSRQLLTTVKKSIVSEQRDGKINDDK